MRRLKQVLRGLVADGRVTSLRAAGRAAGVSTTSWLEYLNGTRDLSTATMRDIVAYVRDVLGIKTPWHELEEIVPDDDETGKRKEFGERLKMRNGQSRTGFQPVKSSHSRDGCATNDDRRRLMISKEVREAFGLRRDPFSHDVEDADGVLLGPVHKRVHDEMFDAAKYGRFAALIAEVGWGKTILRKLLMEELRARGHRICLVEQLDRENLTISRIQDALLSDFAGKHAENMGRESKSREIKQMLTIMHEQDKPCPVLMIDEAHALHPSTLRGLKRLYEIEDGFVKLLSIVLFGQPQMFSRLGGYDLEEVTGRLDIVLAYGLDRLARQGKSGPEPHKIKSRGSYVPTYLAKKLERAGARDPEKVIDADAMQAIAKITDVPLRINAWAARAINHAHRLGYATVTREIIEQLASGEEAK